jgi:DNA-binding transcriptional ArsR family regulator
MLTLVLPDISKCWQICHIMLTLVLLAEERQEALMGKGDDETGMVLRALADPHRRAILRLVAHRELTASEIAQAFDVTRTAVSQHLTVLKKAGLLIERREGTRRLYQTYPAGLDGLRTYLDDLWVSALERARRQVEAERGLSDGDQAQPTG